MSHGAEEDEQSNLTSNFLMVVVVAVVVAIASFNLWAKFHHVLVDPATLCPTDLPPASVTVILIDTTDPIDVLKRTAITNSLTKEIDVLPVYGEIELYTVGSVGGSLLIPQLSVCNPGTGEGKSELTSNPQLMKKRWNQKFFDRLAEVLDRLLTAPSAQNSPIMESIQDLAIAVFQKPEFAHVPKSLIIVSDMVQYTNAYSQYNAVESFRQFKSEPGYLTVHPDLQKVDVTILYLIRPEYQRVQNRRHLVFWQDYFADAGARVVHVIPIEG